jgi:hypothetical protein
MLKRDDFFRHGCRYGTVAIEQKLKILGMKMNSDRDNDFDRLVNTAARGVKLHAFRLYAALETVVRQNAQGHPIGHDAIVAARRALAVASFRGSRAVDWANEHVGAALMGAEVERRPPEPRIFVFSYGGLQITIERGEAGEILSVTDNQGRTWTAQV